MIIDGGSLIKKYESGEAMTPDEKELLLAALYFVYRHHGPIDPEAKAVPAGGKA
jgi:hypothetical protein